MKRGLRLRMLNFRKAMQNFKDYDFLHFGSESCDNLVFHYKDFLKELLLLDKELFISFPPLSKDSFEYSKALILELKKIYRKEKIKFSLNDFGTIELMREMFPYCDIIIGRHLSKSLFSLEKNKLVINSLNLIKFLKKYYKISKYEISSFRDEPSTNLYLLAENKIKISFFIHYPYVLLSTARNCIIGFKDTSSKDTPKGIICNNRCLKTGYKLKLENIGEVLYIFENSIYQKLEKNIFELNKYDFFNIDGFIIDPF